MERLKQLFREYAGVEAGEVLELTSSGSNRRYFRMKSGKLSLIGAIGTSREENHAFINLAHHFHKQNLNVPEVLAVSDDEMEYLQEDLGDDQLYMLVKNGREAGDYSREEVDMLCKAVSKLPEIQFKGAEGLDFGVCYPDSEFNERMVNFDLNYFKYCFLKATGLEFNEVRLQDDFDILRQDLMSAAGNTFMYRDFQARNVMMKDGEPYFIDFQGGRKGPIYYDVASFIWQARSRFSQELKDILIESYLESLKKFTDVDENDFREKLRIFVLFRTLQVLGAYGFRGYFEKKPHFLGSVPYALGSLKKLIAVPFTRYPYLNDVLDRLTRLHHLYEVADDKRLTVSINSFAYKRGIPLDKTGNGGGYVFDCRAINNPGKYEHYRQFNGMDKEVIDFLEEDGEILTFLENVYNMVDAHVQRFQERKFTNLQVNFGCTGGQHRSVYCAEHLAEHLSRKFDVKISVSHRELGIEKQL
ncbi:MAG: phosphotransferase [Bacteroidales bacterium]|nr:phosphotransferase [Bacteroidales bacterium]